MDPSAVDLVRDLAAEAGSISAAARELGMKRSHLEGWIREPSRGFRPEVSRRLALAIGIPFEAVVFKHESVSAIERQLRELLSRPRRSRRSSPASSGPDRPRASRKSVRGRK